MKKVMKRKIHKSLFAGALTAALFVGGPLDPSGQQGEIDRCNTFGGHLNFYCSGPLHQDPWWWLPRWRS